MTGPRLPRPVKDPSRTSQKLPDDNQAQINGNNRGENDIGNSAAGVKPDPDPFTAPINIRDQDDQNDHEVGNQDSEKEGGPPGQEFLHAHQKPGGFDRTGCYRRVGPFLQRGIKQERKTHNQSQDQKKFAELPDDDMPPEGRFLIRSLSRLG